MNRAVEYFNGILFTIGIIDVSIFIIISVFVPAVLSLYLGCYLIKLLNKKLPKLWELFVQSKFIIFAEKILMDISDSNELILDVPGPRVLLE